MKKWYYIVSMFWIKSKKENTACTSSTDGTIR